MCQAVNAPSPRVPTMLGPGVLKSWPASQSSAYCRLHWRFQPARVRPEASCAPHPTVAQYGHSCEVHVRVKIAHVSSSLYICAGSGFNQAYSAWRRRGAGGRFAQMHQLRLLYYYSPGGCMYGCVHGRSRPGHLQLRRLARLAPQHRLMKRRYRNPSRQRGRNQCRKFNSRTAATKLDRAILRLGIAN